MKAIYTACSSLLLICCLSFGPTHLYSQGCSGYEAELEEYFYDYQPGQVVNFRQIEVLYARCFEPTDKMTMLYYYLKAASAWYSANLSEEAAYQDARFYYEKGAQHFTYIIEAPRSDQSFVELFADRARKLEEDLEIYNIEWPVKYVENGSAARYRSQQNPNQVQAIREWKKTDLNPNRDESNTAHARLAQTGFRKGQLTSDGYVNQYSSRSRAVSENARMANRGQGNDLYGEVGDLGALTAMEYLRWRQEHNYPKSKQKESDLEEFDSFSTTGSTDETQAETSYGGLLCIMNQATVHLTPGQNAQKIGSVSFGQVLAQLDDEPAVNMGGKTFISVRLQSGQLGWIDRAAVVPDGRMAVITEHTRAYKSINNQSQRDRNAIILKAGELVVLEGAEGDYIKLVSRNAEKRGWVYGIEAISIDPLDLEIGRQIYLALQDQNPQSRKARLQNIRRLNGFERSELADDVMDLLSNPFSMN